MFTSTSFIVFLNFFEIFFPHLHFSFFILYFTTFHFSHSTFIFHCIFVFPGFTSSEFEVMKQWSGWAHTLRTKESRRKPDKNVIKINVNEIENDHEIGNKNENQNVEAISSVVSGVNKGIEDSENEKKFDLELMQDNKRMKKGEGDVINTSKKAMKEKKVEEEKSESKNRKNESIDNADKKLTQVEKANDKEKGVSNGNENENEMEEDKDNDEHAPPKDQYNINRPTNITYANMAETGKKVKRILDQGRVKFLQNLGLRASQIKYCHPSLSPECIMIVASRQI